MKRYADSLRFFLLKRFGVTLSEDDAATLCRASRTLSRWAELECGDSNDYASQAIERDETTNKPFMVTYPHTGQPRRVAIADRETGALKRIAAICKREGLSFYHQGDPRGCALYLSIHELTDSNYTDGVCA